MDKIYHGRDVLKRQIAEELGYAEKVRNFGWGELTSVEAGRIGGLVTGYMKKHNWGKNAADEIRRKLWRILYICTPIRRTVCWTAPGK